MNVLTWARRGAIGAVGLALLGLASCDFSTLDRVDQPVVMKGSDLPTLIGVPAGSIVAFAHRRVSGSPTWTQVPVQVDERKVVDFGVGPTSNTAAGTTGTVYGTAAVGVTALQYTDAATFVGADNDPNLDANDELVFMASDAGGAVRPEDATEPSGVTPGSGVKVQVRDPLEDLGVGWIYLFRSSGARTPGAGRDYVNYDFNLTSGPYRTTYKRAAGPNPETSIVAGRTYTAGLRDRWDDSEWRITAGNATGVDVLDGLMARFKGTCGRSNLTFQNAEGAFVANIDGPVRAIRSYVGANSGPYTQRTNLFYRDRQEVVTDLRVHEVPPIQDFLDYSAAATGMTYRSSAHPDPVTIDGTPDPIGPELPRWELVSGNQGSITVASRLDTSLLGPGGNPDDLLDEYYRDDLTPELADKPCVGDSALIGASGAQFSQNVPNTDPLRSPFATLSARRTVAYSAPGATTADAARTADQIDAPLETSTTAYAP